MIKKRMLLVGLAMLALAFSSIACDGGDGLVQNMQDRATGGQEALDRLDGMAENLMSPEPIPAYPSDEVLEASIDGAAEVAEDLIENSNELDREILLTVCLAGCDAMYGPLAPVFSDTEVYAACEADCHGR